MVLDYRTEWKLHFRIVRALGKKMLTVKLDKDFVNFQGRIKGQSPVMTFIGNCYVIAPLCECAARADVDSDANSNFFTYVIKYKYDICFISL